MRSARVSDVDRMLAEQAAAWPALKAGLEGLAASETRPERVYGREVLVRHIPHRIKSTTAAVDAVSIARRPCFLCAGNLDPEEQGIAFDGDYTLYCNPFPILERHLTIVHAAHRPQRLEGQAGAMLRLAEALPDSFVIYNGPECGASAPDHLHFQACSRAVFPIARDMQGAAGPAIPGYLPRTFVLRGNAAEATAGRLERLLAILKEVTGAVSEPLVNIAAFFRDGRFTLLVFPRAKHRPEVYRTGEFTVSPATIDLCGVFVVPVRRDFDRIRGPVIEQILDEVTLPADAFEDVLSRMEATA
jgi:hypothetical protein